MTKRISIVVFPLIVATGSVVTWHQPRPDSYHSGLRLYGRSAVSLLLAK